MTIDILTHFRPRNGRYDKDGQAIMNAVYLETDGTASAIDNMLVWRCLEQKNCGICGDDLGQEAAFIGTVEQAEKDVFSTPALHVDCARYAFAAFSFFKEPSKSHKPLHGYRPADKMALCIYEDYKLLLAKAKLKTGVAMHRLNLAKGSGSVSKEVHTGISSMQELLEDGCPAHKEQTVSACFHHRDLLETGASRVVEKRAERTAQTEADKPTGLDEQGKIKNLRLAFVPHNVRIEPNGFPITYDVILATDGYPKNDDGSDFFLERHMLKTKRCGVCGDKLGKEVAFIGTTEMAAKHWFSTPGLHVHCARYSFATCPVLVHEHWESTSGGPDRSAEMHLHIADGYRYSPVRWWIGRLFHGRKRLAHGFAKSKTPWHIESHKDRRAMVKHLNQGASQCPAHKESYPPSSTHGKCPYPHGK